MPANLVCKNDAGEEIALIDLGAIAASSSDYSKFFIGNIGTTTANGCVLSQESRNGSDGISYLSVAINDGTDNPGTFTTDDIFLGDIAAGIDVSIWVKATNPSSVSQQGNPRQANLAVAFSSS